MPNQNQTNLEIVVNGQPTVVTANVNAPLKSVIEKALEQTGNAGQPPDNWEFRNAAGQLLDDSKKVGDFVGDKLFLNLKAGVGG